jgi:hypothetical protein
MKRIHLVNKNAKDNTFTTLKHIAKVLTKKEVEKNRSNAYKYINLNQ